MTIYLKIILISSNSIQDLEFVTNPSPPLLIRYLTAFLQLLIHISLKYSLPTTIQFAFFIFSFFSILLPSSPILPFSHFIFSVRIPNILFFEYLLYPVIDGVPYCSTNYFFSRDPPPLPYHIFFLIPSLQKLLELYLCQFFLQFSYPSIYIMLT